MWPLGIVHFDTNSYNNNNTCYISQTYNPIIDIHDSFRVVIQYFSIPF